MGVPYAISCVIRQLSYTARSNVQSSQCLLGTCAGQHGNKQTPVSCVMHVGIEHAPRCTGTGTKLV